jgi:Na+/H+ antiporter NhaD/arsenite permease-like protein
METLISILVVYCVTHFLVELDGPFDIFLKLQRVKWLGALHCFSCCSVYVAAVVALYSTHTPLEWLVHTFAYAGAAIIIHEIIERV